MSPAGIAEDFPLWGARTMHGATKLSAEHLIEDYIDGYGLRGVVNRFGVIAGPWQREELPGAVGADDGGDRLQKDREVEEDRPAL